MKHFPHLQLVSEQHHPHNSSRLLQLDIVSEKPCWGVLKLTAADISAWSLTTSTPAPNSHNSATGLNDYYVRFSLDAADSAARHYRSQMQQAAQGADIDHVFDEWLASRALSSSSSSSGRGDSSIGGGSSAEHRSMGSRHGGGAAAGDRQPPVNNAMRSEAAAAAVDERSLPKNRRDELRRRRLEVAAKGPHKAAEAVAAIAPGARSLAKAHEPDAGGAQRERRLSFWLTLPDSAAAAPAATLQAELNVLYLQDTPELQQVTSQMSDWMVLTFSGTTYQSNYVLH